MPAIALYYPWTHFQDENWLKLALLTWQRVTRMRPVVSRDQDLVRQLLNESDFLVEATPSPHVLATVAEAFTEIIETAHDRITPRYSVKSTRAEEVNPRPEDPRFAADWNRYTPPVSQAPPEVRRDQYLLHLSTGDRYSKMSAVLADLLVDRGLAERPSDWVAMHPKFGSIYLAVLADVMARSESLAPATDDPRMHNAVGALDRLTGLLLDDVMRTPALDGADSAYLHLALQSVLEPDDLAGVPVAKLIEFRERHRAELAAFHEHVAGLGAELQAAAASENLELAAAHLRSVYETRTKPQLDDLRRALRGLGIESSAGTLVQKIDLNATAGTVLAAVAAAGGQLAVAGAAVAVTLVPYLAGKAKARRSQVKNSPVAYLLAADRELSGRSLLGALHRSPTRRGS